MGVVPQPQPRIPTDNANVFIKVLQSLQHSQTQMMEEISHLKTDKINKKGSQHDLEYATDKEETPAGGVPQNAEQRFIIMAEVATLLERERARALKERFNAQRPPYPLKVLSKPYLKRYEPWAFA